MSTTSKLYTFHELMTDGILMEYEGKKMRRKVGRILIPMIQRPYAQGRKSQQSIRNKFLQDIFNALEDNSTKKLELNFIYGTFVEEGKDGSFELLDGQQRLTTLFLLHWYIAAIEHTIDDSISMPDYLRKFEYQTRTTSTDFLRKLFTAKINISKLPSKTLRKASWYSKSFDKDSTVDSMLRLLDAISLQYAKATIKPTFQDLNKLQFYVLELNGFGLSEELFIKMNARGLQLTPFENFKADLVGYMKMLYTQSVPMTLSNMSRAVPYWLNFSSLVDGKWSNLFWEKTTDEEKSGSKECDAKFFRFIQRYFACKSILLVEKSNEARIADDELFVFFSKNIDIERHYGFAKYAEIIAKGKEKGINLILQLEHLLNFLCDKSIGYILLNALTAPWESQPAWQPWGTEGEVGLRQMILLSVLIEYVSHINSIQEFDEASFVRWMHFANCMVQSTDVNQVKNQITLTRLLNEALTYHPKDDVDFNAWEHPYEAIVGFNKSRRDNRYLEAEAQKASQILQDSHWEEAFLKAEKDAFLQGSVTFYYEEGMDISVFQNRTENIPNVFNKNGVVDELAKDCLLIRAVLCRDYDWRGMKKNVTNINITNRSADRHLRNLTIWNTNPEVKRLFCQLLDCKTLEERVNLLKSIAEEKHELILRMDGYWSHEALINLQTLYNRLHSEEEMQVLRWFYSHAEIKMMGVWINANGTGSLYKGPVNCIMITTERHKTIHMVIERYKETFDFQYKDVRQVDTLKRFKNYSGTEISLCSKRTALPNNVKLKLTFLAYGSLCIEVIGEDKAKMLFDTYKKIYGTVNIHDRYEHDIADSEGNLSFYMENAEKCNRVNYIANACSMPIEDLFHVLDVAYKVLSKGKENEE